MSISIEQMRAELLQLYAGVTWRARVMKMPDAQVIAIYRRRFGKEG